MDATEQMQIFVNGLKMKTKQLIDTTVGGSTNFTTATRIKKIIGAIAPNEHLELYDRSVSQPKGIIDLKLANQVVKMEDQITAEVERKLKKMDLNTQTVEQVQPIQAVPREADWEIAIEKMAAQSSQFQEETRSNLRNTGSSIKNMEMQMSQISQQLAGSQASSALPSATVTNPREHNNVSAVVVPKLVVKEKVSEPKSVVKLPFPTRNKKKAQHEKNFDKFLEMFKKLEINIPFLEALEQMPSYAKFMKDIISKKRSIDTDPIVLTETCSAILQGMKIPVKKKDRGSVTIPCIIGDRSFKKALIDMGASVSLMPLSIYKRLGIGKVQDTKMTLQFADHSVKRPYGVVEDVLVKIAKFVFSVDFVILEMPKDEKIPLILGRPFLETGRCLIDIEEGTMTLKVYDEELKIDV
ncbi:uncharacterized protein LOC127131427 [Lathyrus oleraceus]|uniref:uncharacterized protein LOC127131427 n=1 Tax=Pisum sativum TaxID=3888 RepID=UPI0021D3A8D9|nr:uncharacterized protein LOC127131427 [Pisum sativum]